MRRELSVWAPACVIAAVLCIPLWSHLPLEDLLTVGCIFIVGSGYFIRKRRFGVDDLDGL